MVENHVREAFELRVGGGNQQQQQRQGREGRGGSREIQRNRSRSIEPSNYRYKATTPRNRARSRDAMSSILSDDDEEMSQFNDELMFYLVLAKKIKSQLELTTRNSTSQTFLAKDLTFWLTSKKICKSADQSEFVARKLLTWKLIHRVKDPESMEFIYKLDEPYKFSSNVGSMQTKEMWTIFHILKVQKQIQAAYLDYVTSEVELDPSRGERDPILVKI